MCLSVTLFSMSYFGSKGQKEGYIYIIKFTLVPFVYGVLRRVMTPLLLLVCFSLKMTNYNIRQQLGSK